MRWLDSPRWDWAMIALWGPVVAVAALAQAGVGLEHPWTGSDLSLSLTSLLLAAPLAIRVRQPMLATALVAVAIVVQDALGGSLGFASFVTVLLAAFSGGRHLPSRRAALVVVVLLAGVLVSMRSSLPHDAEELIFPLFYVSAATIIGSVVRRLASQAADLRLLNAALAAERDASARLAIANERMRLARDLHDVVAHTLTVVVVQSENAEQALDGADVTRAGAAVRAVQEAGRRGLADLRSMVRVLREPDAPDAVAGLAEVDALAAVMAGAGLDVVVRREGDLSRVPDAVGRELARVVQEALTNVVKHSAAGEAVVRLVGSTGEIVVTVEDPGPALASTFPSGRVGLRGMAERLAPHGGTVTSGPYGDGFRVCASVPLTRAADLQLVREVTR